MSDRYSWEQGGNEPSYRSSNSDHLGWWAAAAMLASILLHVVVFFALDQVKFALGIQPTTETTTREVVIRDPTEVIPEERFTPTPPPEEFVAPPPQDTAKLLDEVDLLDAVKDLDVEMKPQVVETTIAIMPSNPAAAGDPKAVASSISPSVDLAADLPDLGRSETQMKPAAVGQLTVDPGSVKTDAELSKFTDDLIKKGANGKAEKGSLEGIASLDELIGLPSNELLGKKTMLPSDLIFEFNKYDLRESAKIGLFKLTTLIDNNPGMYCWIEGHTDLIGGDAANLELSVRRAEAVKQYLVTSMQLNPDKIITRGYGRFHPIITAGDKDQQAPNRRVEIKMRKTPPTEEQMKIAPPKAAAVPEEMPPARPAPVPVPSPPPAPPKATLVRPSPERAKELEGRVMPAPPAPKAMPVEEAPPAPAPAPRARPVEPEMPSVPPAAKAIPVAEDEPNVLKAQPVTE